MKQPDTTVRVDPVTGFPVTPPRLYAPRDPVTLEPHYSAHVAAMTSEGLHAKSLIAAELAWRDQEIARLQADVLRLQILSADVADVIVEHDNGYRRCLACDHQWHMDEDTLHDDECVLLRLEAEVTIQRTGKDHMREARKSKRQP